MCVSSLSFWTNADSKKERQNFDWCRLRLTGFVWKSWKCKYWYHVNVEPQEILSWNRVDVFPFHEEGSPISVNNLLPMSWLPWTSTWNVSSTLYWTQGCFLPSRATSSFLYFLLFVINNNHHLKRTWRQELGYKTMWIYSCKVWHHFLVHTGLIASCVSFCFVFIPFCCVSFYIFWTEYKAREAFI